MSNVTIQSNGSNGRNDIDGSNVAYFVITYQLLPCYYIIMYAFRLEYFLLTVTTYQYPLLHIIKF